MSYERGLELVLATLNNIDVTTKIKSYYGKNNDLANVTSDPRRKSFSPGYSRISKGTTPIRNTTS